MEKLGNPEIKKKIDKEFGNQKEIDELNQTIKNLEETNELDEERIKIGECYESIIEILKEYCDLREDYYPIISLWIIGTYFHKMFPTYSYLYFNAMKGGGKTRILKLISNLTKNGKIITSLSEAVLFRTASHSAFCIDEFENVSGKEKQALRELLNSAYKRGLSVERVKKVKTTEGESFVVEKYNLYCPICMANIWGMEEVLGDRCINLLMEKSDNPVITKILENFEENEKISKIKEKLGSVSSEKWGNSVKGIYKEWNFYIIKRYNNTTITLLTTTTINNTNTTFFNKIANTSLNSRHLELFFPLFILADICQVTNKIIEIAEKMVSEKKEADIDESRDVCLIDFVSEKTQENDFIPLRDVLKGFKGFYFDEEDDGKWLNSKWIGRALKRVGLIKERRKVNGRREVILNAEKAKKKILMFREVKQKDKLDEKKEVEILKF